MQLRHLMSGFKVFLHIPAFIKYCYALNCARKAGIISSIFYESHGHYLLFKHLGKYLYRSTTTEKRISILTHSYQTMYSLKNTGFNLSLCKPTKIWGKEINGTPVEMFIRRSEKAIMEGEITLSLEADRKSLFTITFSFARGEHLQLPYGEVLLICGVQGLPGTREEARDISKRLGEIAPQFLLMIGLRALSRAFAIPTIIGISSSERVPNEYSSDRITFDYDEFWQHCGGQALNQHFYLIMPEGQQKPIEMISRSHRKRTLKKRMAKAQLEEDIFAGIRSLAAAE